jgi:hypothetical protein
MTTELTRYDAACRALAAAVAIDEVKDIRDQAMAMACYARQAKNRDLEADAVELRMRATRRLDEMRQAQKATVGLAKGGGGKHGRKRVAEKPTLKDAGIDKNLAHQARQLGALSEQEFEQKVAETRDAVTSAGSKGVKSITSPKEKTVTVRDDVDAGSEGEAGDLRARNEQLEAENVRLRRETIALRSEIEDLRRKLADGEMTISEFQATAKQWEDTFETQRSIIAKLESELASLRAGAAAPPADDGLDIPDCLDRTKQRVAP